MQEECRNALSGSAAHCLGSVVQRRALIGLSNGMGGRLSAIYAASAIEINKRRLWPRSWPLPLPLPLPLPSLWVGEGKRSIARD